MQTPKISLIIPAYNEEKYIGPCLEAAIKNSKGRLFEIIVIDNASTDKTQEIAQQFPGVMVVPEPRKGLTRARQRGFLSAHGDVLAYIDADTLMPKTWYDLLEKEFIANPRLAALSGPYIFYELPAWMRFLVSTYWHLVAYPSSLLLGYMTIGGNFAIRRDVIEKMSGFDTSIEFYGEDFDIGRRARVFGKVKFNLKFPILTSARRFQKQGLFSALYEYVINDLSEIFLHKPVTKEYKDYR